MFGGPLTLSGTLNNSGVIVTSSNNYSTLTLQLGGQGLVNNQACGLFAVAGSYGLNVNGTTNSAFANAGTLLSSVNGMPAGINFTGILFNNTGLVDLQNGTISFDNAFSQSAGSLSLSGSGVSFQSTHPMQISGGTVAGSGTIIGSIINTGGTVQPGNSLGCLTITGSYTQSGSGMLDMAIGGTLPVTGYNQLIIAGQASLGGTLQASCVNGFQPAAGQSYALISYGSLASNSLGFNLPVPGSDLLFSESFSPTQFTLNVTRTALSQWKQDQFGANAGNPAMSGDTVVNNGAGIANLMAYALGLNPFAATASGLPASIIKNYIDANYLSLTFNRDTTAADITYTVEVTSDLTDPNSWTPLATSINGSATTGPGFVSETGNGNILSVEVRDTQPVGTQGSRFMRLRVTH
jgi:hypothetical protein